MNRDLLSAATRLPAQGTRSRSIPVSFDIERPFSARPLDHFRSCCALLDEARRLNGASKMIRSYETALADPIGRYYQPSIAALALIASMTGKSHDAVEPRLFASNAPMGTIGGGRQADLLLPIPIARRLAELWNEIGRLENHRTLIQSAEEVEKWLCRVACDSPQLFFQERDFNEHEIAGYKKSAKEGRGSIGSDGFLGVARISTDPVDACLTLSGWNTGLGVLRLQSVDIPSFGPHRFPLCDLDGFGIAQIIADHADIAAADRLSFKGWTRCFGAQDTWIEVRAVAGQEGVDIGVRWIGIEPGSSGLLAMAFFIKAKSCQLEDGTEIRLQSMQKFEGKSQKIIFNQAVRLECSEPLNMHVIPLAGSGCFWNSTYLAAFEINSSQNQSSYSFRIL